MSDVQHNRPNTSGAPGGLERLRQLDSRCPGHPEYRWFTPRAVAVAARELMRRGHGGVGEPTAR